MSKTTPIFLAFLITGSQFCSADEPVQSQKLAAPHPIRPSDYSPPIAGASDEGEKAIASFKPAEGLKVSLFAAEPLLANPVAFCFDERGRCFVAETFRQERGVEDNRGHMIWLDDDIASQTVEDRLAMFRKHLGEKVNDYAKEHDRIRVLIDNNGDGVAEASKIFADGFNDILAGTGSGVLARGGKVYYACIPHLWMLSDKDDDGVADLRQSLHYGYGVHVAFRGHDSHGFVIGPDGKLYFSIGDRGFNIQTEGHTVARPHTGAVLRCNLDGSELEVFADGLRNPQELAFDEYGNLFTCDNNSDSGDRARWVHVVEGGNSGWMMSYQYFPDRGPWNREKLWHPQHEGQAAYIVPPLANFADGPSGLAYYPGTGLAEKYNGAFLLCDFRGTPAQSGVHAVWLKPKGASFELAKNEHFLWGILATDVDFGPDGAVYVSDWVDGWNGTGKGRIYKVFDPELSKTPEAQAVFRLLAGVDDNGNPLPPERYIDKSADMRAHRQFLWLTGAHDAGKEGFYEMLPEVVLDPQKKAQPGNKRLQILRLNCLWCLQHVVARARRSNSHALDGWCDVFAEALNQEDAEIRAQAAKALGDLKMSRYAPQIAALLKDPSPRVRFFAAISLGKVGDVSAVAPLLVMLNENSDKDVYLRHAGVMGLAGAGEAATLSAAAKDASSSARLAIVLALRRQGAADELATFLDDVDPIVVVEAARAINDDLLESALPSLARLTARPQFPDPIVHRALNANFRLGQAENAAAVAALAAHESAIPAMRVEALRMLADWATPHARDRIVGLSRPLPNRDENIAPNAVRPRLAGMFAGSAEVRREAARLAKKLNLGDAGPLLFSLAIDGQAPRESRIDALAALTQLRDARLKDAIEKSLADGDAGVRAAAQSALAQTDPARAITVLREVLQQQPGTQEEKQGALAALGDMRDGESAELLQGWLGRMQQGKVPAEIQLDLLLAAGKRKSNAVQDLLRRYESSRPKDDVLASYRETLAGGDVHRGETIFFEQINVSCRRCHKVGTRGGNVGPELTSIAKEKNREYLLESLVLPDKTIAKGFESVILNLDDGTTVSGILKGEDEVQLKLQTPQGNFLTIEKSSIDERGRGKSAMPEDVEKYLSKRDIRDLVEYLSTLK